MASVVEKDTAMEDSPSGGEEITRAHQVGGSKEGC
jgi:hypothetical protein